MREPLWGELISNWTPEPPPNRGKGNASRLRAAQKKETGDAMTDKPIEIAERWRDVYRQTNDFSLGFSGRATTRQLIEELSAAERDKVVAEEQFAKHTRNVGCFLSQMYATMVDPLESSEMKVKELCELLLARAAEDVESLARLASAEARVRELETWKESQLAVEASWDDQAVGRELGLTLGSPIRPQILPAIKDLRAKLSESEAIVQSWFIENSPGGWIDELRQQVARLSAPMSDEEWANSYWQKDGGMRSFVNALIAARTAPPASTDGAQR